MTAKNAGQRSTTFSTLIRRLEELGRARDGIIVALAVVYILGFLSWAIYSLRTNIGFIRIFDAQYLIGGILPSLLISIVYAGWKFFRYSRFTWVAKTIFLIGFVVSSFLIPTSVRTSSMQLGPSLTAFLMYAVLLALLGSAMTDMRKAFERAFAAPPRTSRTSLGDAIKPILLWLRAAFLGLVCVSGAFAAIYIYIFLLYPNLPQALGGPEPRCASIALDPKKLPQTLLRKFSVNIEEHEAGTVLLADTHVLYNDDKVLIFRPSNTGKDLTSVEVRKELVDSIAWCED